MAQQCSWLADHCSAHLLTLNKTRSDLQAHPLKALIAAGLADPLLCCKTAVQYFRGGPPGGAAWFQALWAGSDGCSEAEAWEATMQLRQLPAAAIWEVLHPQLLVSSLLPIRDLNSPFSCLCLPCI